MTTPCCVLQVFKIVLAKPGSSASHAGQSTIQRTESPRSAAGTPVLAHSVAAPETEAKVRVHTVPLSQKGLMYVCCVSLWREMRR